MFVSLIRHTFRVLTTIAMIAAAAVPAVAQNPTGTISGRVIDSGGLPVAGASVTVQSPSLQGSRTTKTSENGDYRLPLLPPGEYMLHWTVRTMQDVKVTQGNIPFTVKSPP